MKGPVLLIGAVVEYYPIAAKDLSRLHQFGKKALPEIFLGNVLYAGGTWKGDILVADIEQLEKMDASEIHGKRLNANKNLSTPRVHTKKLSRCLFSQEEYANKTNRSGEKNAISLSTILAELKGRSYPS